MANIKLSNLNATTLTALNQSEMNQVVGGRRGWVRYGTRINLRGLTSFSAYKSFNNQVANNVSIVIQVGDNNIATVYQSAVNIIQ